MYTESFLLVSGAELALGFLVGQLKIEMPFGRPLPPAPAQGSQPASVTVLCPWSWGVGLGWGLRMFPGNRSPLGELPGQAQAPWAMS